MTVAPPPPPPPPPLRLHLPLWRLVAESHRQAWYFLRANPVPMLVLAVLSYASGFAAEPLVAAGVPAISAAVILPGVLLLCMLAAGMGTFAWLQSGERMPLLPFLNLVDRRAFVFAWRTLSLGGAALGLMLAATAVGSLLAGIAIGFDAGSVRALEELQRGAAWDWSRHGRVIAIMSASIGTLVLVATLIGFRLSLVMPAALSPRPLGMIALWRITRGHGLTVIGVVAVALVPTLLLLGLLGAAAAATEGWLRHALGLAFQLDLMVHGVVNSSAIFMVWRALPGHGDLSPDSPVPPLAGR